MAELRRFEVTSVSDDILIDSELDWRQQQIDQLKAQLSDALKAVNTQTDLYRKSLVEIERLSGKTTFCAQCEAYAKKIYRLEKVSKAASCYYTFPSAPHRVLLKQVLSELE